MNWKTRQDIRRKLKVLDYARETGNVSRACRYHGVSRESYYQWKRAYDAQGEAGLINNKPCPDNPVLLVRKEIEGKILHLRRTYHLGPLKISRYLARHHQIAVSRSGCYYVLQRHGLNRLPDAVRERPSHSYRRHEKQTPGHHVQVGVKLLSLVDKAGNPVKRFQYTAIDGATRTRAIKIYDHHTRHTAISFADYVIMKFPFRISIIRTDDGHEFQGRFQSHLEDLGIEHACIKPEIPRHNGKVEHSDLTDKHERSRLMY